MYTPKKSLLEYKPLSVLGLGRNSRLSHKVVSEQVKMSEFTRKAIISVLVGLAKRLKVFCAEEADFVA